MSPTVAREAHMSILSWSRSRLSFAQCAYSSGSSVGFVKYSAPTSTMQRSSSSNVRSGAPWSRAAVSSAAWSSSHWATPLTKSKRWSPRLTAAMRAVMSHLGVTGWS
eukprot:6884511-Pyramimonas_sp.AAC.1